MDKDRTDRFTDLPPSFEQQMAPNYLGNPNVVAGIVQPYLTEILEWVKARSAGTMTAPEMTARAHERAAAFARDFAGENPAYLPIEGWNTRVGGLQETIKADLGHYWQSQRAAHGDDPYQVLYAWLVWAVVDALKDGDDDMANFKMGQRVQQLIRMLTGSAKRKGV
jgi:hypothetical protein